MIETRKNCIIFYIIYIFISCKNENRQLQCYKEYVSEVINTPDSRNLLLCFKDTLNNWLHIELNGVNYLKDKETDISKAIFFNRDKSKSLILLAIIDKDTGYYFDNVQIIGAEKLSNKWNFYLQSYPTILYDRRELIHKRPFTSRELFDRAIKFLLEDGYFYKYSCKINYNYLENGNWFNEERRKMHRKFLNNL